MGWYNNIGALNHAPFSLTVGPNNINSGIFGMPAGSAGRPIAYGGGVLILANGTALEGIETTGAPIKATSADDAPPPGLPTNTNDFFYVEQSRPDSHTLYYWKISRNQTVDQLKSSNQELAMGLPFGAKPTINQIINSTFGQLIDWTHRVDLGGSRGNDNLTFTDFGSFSHGWYGSDTLTGGAGRDDYWEGARAGDRNTIDGKGGIDGVNYSFRWDAKTNETGIIINGGVEGGGLGDTLTNVEAVYGTEKADDILVPVSNAVIDTHLDSHTGGDAGNDKIRGNAQRNEIFGGTGSDTLYGGDGNDVIFGNIQFHTSGGEFDEIHGDDGADRLYADLEGWASIEGGDGNDVIFGGDGADTLNGGDDNDFIQGYSETSSPNTTGDTMDGGNGNDTLIGAKGNDSLAGGDDDDLINGGDGDDLIDGGDGKQDVAVYSGLRSDYNISYEDGYVRIKGAGGDDRLTHVEYAQFDDFRLDLLFTYPFILKVDGRDFTDDDEDGTFNGLGLIDIGRQDGTAGLKVHNGDGSYDAKGFKTRGDYYFGIGGVDERIFSGSFEASFANGSGAVVDGGGEGFELAGIELVVNKMAILADSIRTGVTFTLPDELGGIELSGITMIFDENGVHLGIGAAASLAQEGSVTFGFFGLFKVRATDQSLSYDDTTETLKYQGVLEIQDRLARFLPEDNKIRLDLAGDNAVTIREDGVDFVGELKYQQSSVYGKWGFKGFSLAVDTVARKVVGTITVGLPLKVDVSGKIGFVVEPDFDRLGDLQINMIAIEASGMTTPLPFAPSVTLRTAGGTIDHMASGDTEPVSFTGTLGFSSGPKISGQYLATLNITGTLDENHLSGAATLVVGSESILKATGALDWNWNEGFMTGTMTVTVLNAAQTTVAVKITSNLDFEYSYTGSISVPEWATALGGETIASANVRVSYTNNGTLHDDYAKAWYQATWQALGYSITGKIGVQLNFDLTSDFIGFDLSSGAPSGLGRASFALAASSGSGFSAAGADILYLTAKWSVSQSGDVELVVIDPDGNEIFEGDFAANGIEVVEELSSAFNKVVAIGTPGTGNWDLAVVDATGLGDVSYRGQVQSLAPEIIVDAVAAPDADGNVEIAYTATDGSDVTFYYDDDASGHDGIAMKGTFGDDGSFVWNSGGVLPGTYYVYAVAQNGSSAPEIAYSSQTTTLTHSADLAVTVAGPDDLLGESASYTLTVTNIGPDSAQDVRVEDLMPPGWRLANSDVPATAHLGRQLVFSLGTLAAGASTTITLALERGVPTLDTSLDHSSIDSAFDLDTHFFLGDDTDVAEAHTLEHASIATSGNGTEHYYAFTVGADGETLTFDIDGTNNWNSVLLLFSGDGNLIATNDDGAGDAGSNGGTDPLLVHSFAEAGTYYIAVQSSESPAVALGHSYRLNVLRPGTGTASTSVNSVYASTTTYDPDLSNNGAFDQSVIVGGLATTDLAVSMTEIDASLTVGDPVQTTITITNNGKAAATGVQFSLNLFGIDSRLVEASKGSVLWDEETATVSLGTIAVGESIAVTVTGLAGTAGQVGGYGLVVADQIDSDERNNELAFVTAVAGATAQPADLGLSLVASERTIDDRQLVSLRLANAGPGHADSVTVLAPTANGASLNAGSTVTGSYSAESGVWSAGTLMSGTGADLVLVVDAASPRISLFTAQVQTSGVADLDSFPGNSASGEDDQVSALLALGNLKRLLGTDTPQTITGTTAADAIYALGGNDSVNGGKGDDVLFGEEGNDKLQGKDGNDWLHGGRGNDTIDGGSGNDTVTYADETGPVTIRLDKSTSTSVNSGVDRLTSIENAEGGSGADIIYGSAAANRLTGFAGNDQLAGKGGKDTLIGGSGIDWFVFDMKPSASNVDTIIDFEHDTDLVALDDAIFKAIGPSLLEAAFYRSGGAVQAHDADDRIIYDTNTGRLYYDADGTGRAKSVHFATLNNAPSLLDHGDFIIV